MARRNTKARSLVAVLVSVVVAATLAAACGSSDAAPKAESAVTVQSGVEALVEEYLPPAPTAEQAGRLQPPCEPHHDDMVMDDGAPSATTQAADGTYERTFTGMNPRVEVSAVPFDTAPTDAERQAAADFVQEVTAVAAANGWSDPRNVVRDGYRPFSECNLHYANVANMLDGRELDPQRPEFVMMEADHDGTLRFTGVMFVAESRTGHGPQRFGTLGLWHYHADAMCGVGGMTLVSVDPDDCPDGTRRYEHSPEMLHVMTEGPNPFDSSMM